MFERAQTIAYAKQMRLILSLLLALSVCSLGAKTVYKIVDEDGHVIFTDKPSENAEEIKLQDLQTIKNPNPSKLAPKPRLPDETSAVSYKTFMVSTPADGSGVRSNNGNVTISVFLEPALRSNHKISISMDGKEVGSGNSVLLENVDRGTHSINASVVDVSGKRLISTSSTFSLLRTGQ